MSGELTISLSSEILDTGPAEERATFGLLAVMANDRLLTEGIETESHRVRRGPYVSGYPLAEWLLWNWWRIRWEVRRPSETGAARRWHFAHSLQTIGDGYVWPDITLASDSVSAFLASRPTSDSAAVLFRYLGASRREKVPVASLESGVDEFLGSILSRLENNGIRESNVHRLWRDLQTERDDPELSRYRKLEAQLGFDPDEADEALLRTRLDDAARLGDEALGELASDETLEGNPLHSMMSAQDISDIAKKRGVDADLDSAVRLSNNAQLPRPGQVEPWRLGKEVARGIRDQERLDGLIISDDRLTELAGTVPELISNTNRRSPGMSFLYRTDNGSHARISLRSSWKTGRRFELARLIGDRLVGARVNESRENLYPAIRSFSYRQKMQRAFAAELLSPIAAVDEMLRGDYSEERQNRVARHFSVSPMTIQAQLVNHNRIFIEDAPDIYGRDSAFPA